MIDLGSINDFEITGKLSASNKGFGVYVSSSQSDGGNWLAVGVDGGNYCMAEDGNNGTITSHASSWYKSYSTNSKLDVLFRKQGTNVTLTIDDKTTTFNYSQTDLRYLKIRSWNNTGKTITYEDFIVKQL